MLSLRANFDALRKQFDQLTQTVSAIRIPDVSGFATKQDVTTVANAIPVVPPAPDLSGFATKTALATVEGKIPVIPPAQDLSGYATKSALSTVENKIPSISGLATQASLDQLTARTASVLPGDYTVDTLPIASAQYLDKYARVTDLFGVKRDLVLCSMVDTTYFWQPVRKEFAKNMTLNTDVTLTTLKSPTIILAAGTLLANRTISLSNTYAYPGASFEVGFDGNLGLFGISIKNNLGATLGSLLAGGRKRYFFADGSWQNF